MEHVWWRFEVDKVLETVLPFLQILRAKQSLCKLVMAPSSTDLITDVRVAKAFDTKRYVKKCSEHY